jgi:hypothetical protein
LVCSITLILPSILYLPLNHIISKNKKLIALDTKNSTPHHPNHQSAAPINKKGRTGAKPILPFIELLFNRFLSHHGILFDFVCSFRLVSR